MLLDNETRVVIDRFNSNVEWLKKNIKAIGAESPNYPAEWIGYNDVSKILGRQKTWIRNQIIDADKVDGKTDVNKCFVKGVDCKLDGKFMRFKKASVERVLSSLLGY